MTNVRPCSLKKIDLDRYITSTTVQAELGDLKEKIIKIAWWPKRFFVKATEARTATMEPLIAVFSPVDKLQFELLPNCILFFKLKLQRKKKQLVRKTLC